jgi:organic hydroperoxide reductase OsmC/OhrA
MESGIVTVVKDYQFSTAVRWQERGGPIVATAPGRPLLRVAVPVELRGREAALWSPEELLVTAVASSFAVTLDAVAAHRGLELKALEVEGLGHVESGREGHLRFVAIELKARIEAAEAALAPLEEAARTAEELSIVHRALDTPVHLELELRPADADRNAA